jgi:carotenoid cleavage dioxygenase
MSEDRIAALEAKLAEMDRRLTVREDELDVKKLQYLYGYLIDKCMYNEVVDLFADDGEVRFFGGVWKGKAGVKRLYVDRFQKRFTYGNNGPIDGFLLDHPQIQTIIDIDETGTIAKLRGRSTMQAGRHKDYEGAEPHLKARQWWEGGLYENTYVKGADGKWRIKCLNYFPHWHADFEKGWAYTPDEYVPFPKVLFPEDPSGPDALIDDHWLWPTHKLLPFHMKHPITGKEMVAQRWQGDEDRAKAKQKA